MCLSKLLGRTVTLSNCFCFVFDCLIEKGFNETGSESTLRTGRQMRLIHSLLKRISLVAM